MSDAYQRVAWRGVTLNRRTAAMMEAAQRRMGRPFGSIPQGSYHSSTSASAGTHDGGGAVDIYDPDLARVQTAMRAVGFAAWVRPTLPGVWSAHVHAIAIGDAQMSSGAASQVRDYYAHRDGLASHAYDNAPRPQPIPVFNYQNQAQEEDDMQTQDFERIAAIVARHTDPIAQALAAFRQGASERDRHILAAIDRLPDGSLTRTDVRAVVNQAMGA